VRKPLSIALEEVEAGKIEAVPLPAEGDEEAAAEDAEAAELVAVASSEGSE